MTLWIIRTSRAEEKRMFHKRRERKERKERERVAQERERVAQKRAAREAEASALAAKADRIGRLADQLADPAGLWNEASPDCPIVAKRGEEMLTVFSGVSLLELRSQKRTYRGTSHGLSIRIAKGVYYRPGIHSGSITETTETWKPLDTGGDMVITNQRVVYAGTRYSREFPFAKLLSWGLTLEKKALDRPQYLVTLPVSIRVRTSAIAFPSTVKEEIKDLIVSVVQCGISLYNGTHEDFLQQLQADAADMRSRAREMRNQLPPVA